jgi:hypothetical protein
MTRGSHFRIHRCVKIKRIRMSHSKDRTQEDERFFQETQDRAYYVGYVGLDPSSSHHDTSPLWQPHKVALIQLLQ